jgi:hypothetical protein
MSAAPDRGRVWKLLGAPSEQIGSVNDPRFHEEHGVQWNEKWLWLGEDGRSVLRVALWNRYDLVGIFRIGADGEVEAETLPDA